MGTDLRAVLNAVWLPFCSWLAAVIMVAVGGKQPGVVCVTPMAWLMALWVGLRCAVFTRNEKRSGRLTEAALAGGILGVLQGLLCAAIIPLMGAIKREEQLKTAILIVAVILIGAVVSALLSLAICASQESKRSVSR
jgi:hypothetical protein